VRLGDAVVGEAVVGDAVVGASVGEGGCVSVGDGFGDLEGDGFGDSLGEGSCDSLGDGLGDTENDGLGDPVTVGAIDAVGSSVGDGAGSCVGNGVPLPIPGRLGDRLAAFDLTASPTFPEHEASKTVPRTTDPARYGPRLTVSLLATRPAAASGRSGTVSHARNSCRSTRRRL
jgi:hypothetical protein